MTFLHLQDDNLLMRPLTLEDAPEILALNLDPAWQKYIGDRGVYDLASARQYLLNGPQTMYREHGFGILAVCDVNGQFLGTCGLLKRDSLRCPDIGFAFLPAARGKGVAFRAASMLCQAVAKSHQWPYINGLVTPENIPSVSLLKKLGFVFHSDLPDFDAAKATHLYRLTFRA